MLVHGAYRTGNLLVDDDRVSAVLDWELQVIGDPMYDVAYVLSDLNREGTDLLSNLVDRDDFYRDYEAATGIEIDDDACRYYQLLYAMRSVAFWMSASDLYATGRSRRPPAGPHAVVDPRRARARRPGSRLLST